MQIHIFNPEHDAGPANGDENFVPPRSAVRFAIEYYVVSILVLLLAFSYNANATRQFRDVIIIDKVEHGVNKVLLYQLDSVTYDALGKKLEFDKCSHSANWRGHVSTFEVKGNKLFLNSIETSKVRTDFNGLLDRFKDNKGMVLASWVSGTFICSTGECLYVSENGFDDIYEQETELVVENGVIISSRTYCNKTNGTLYLDDASRMISQNLDLSKIKAPKGRVSVKIYASEFSNEGKVTVWSVDFLRGADGLSAEIKEMIVQEINRVFNLVDWKTYRRDGKWCWTPQNAVTYPLIFQ